MKTLYPDVSHKGPKEVVIIVHAAEGSLKNLLHKKRDYIDSNGAILHFANTSIWTGQVISLKQNQSACAY